MLAKTKAEDRHAARLRRVDGLIQRLESVRSRVTEAERHVPLAAFGAARDSARNLVHYLALRQFDLREVQDRLADLGLSSLGRAEGHVLYNLDTVLARLYSLMGSSVPPASAPAAIDPERGRWLIARNASRLFGRAPPERATRIMVTLPTEAASDPRFLRELLRSGTDAVRINCAHDSEREWAQMIRNLRRAERELGKGCRLEMDLGGPRLRTGPVEPGPTVLRVRPPRDPMGRPLRPAVIQFVAADRALRPEEPGAMVDATLVAPIGWIRRRRIHERLTLRDTRGARRLLRVESRSGDQLLVTTEKATYFTNGLQLQGRSVRGRKDSTSVEGVEPRPGRIRLAPGDRLLLRPDPAPGRDRVPGGRGRHAFASIGVSHPRLLGRVRPGDQVWFDSGRIGGVARSTSRAGVVVEVVRAPPAGTWLRADQGINLPDTDLRLPSLTEEDRAILPFIVRHADLVGFSFVQSAQGVEALRDELRRLGRPRMGIVLKIETRRAFDKLPAILLSALRHGPAGVMVARGDLAVEVGFERLAEVQEEILWLCEAAHLPAIWATQVLEGLAKSGIPSRAEVTDAAMGERAECVMLNKGPFLIPAVRALDGIVRRMQAHQAKKSARLRHLNVAERFLESTSIPGEAIVTTNEGR